MAATQYGTQTTLDTLAANFQTVAEIGEDDAFAAVDAALAAHNQILMEQLDALVERTTDRLKRYGGPASMQMQELDQWGTPDAQKVGAGATVGFPLRKYGNALQWTRSALQVLTGAELAAQVNALMDSDKVNLSRQIKKAIFIPTNYTFEDILIDDVQLAVKALVNADSAAIPLGPQGEEFDGATHTHYLATASLVEANVVSLITTVIEHYGAGSVYLYINQAQEATVRAMAKFFAYVINAITQSDASIRAEGRDLAAMPLNNRAIGVFETGGAEVWVKPWIPASYMFCFVAGQPKPLVMRIRSNGQGAGDLQLVFEDEAHPLRARGYEREFGMSVWNRTNGAVLYTASGTYAAPTL